jgi:hypothetical protein
MSATRVALTLAVLLACHGLPGQSVTSSPRLRMFHIHGVVRKCDGSVVPDTRIRFKGDKFEKTVFTDERGLYEADLPLEE